VPGVKTNEVPGTRAVLRHYRMSASKARQVLDLVRGMDVDRAEELLRTTPREAARVVGKVLASAVANARNNDQLDPEDLYVSACFADEGTTLKRWRPRARGRATRIRKRTCHITVIVSRLPEDRLERRRVRRAEATTAMRSRRVAASRRGGGRGEGATGPGADVDEATALADHDADVEVTDTDVEVTDTDVEVTDTDVEVTDTDVEVTDTDVEATEEVVDTTDTDTDTDTEVDQPEAPAAEDRRARAARKSTEKASDEAGDADGDDGGAADEEKG